MPRPVVPPIPGAPGKPVNAVEHRVALADWIIKNFGVLVAAPDDDSFACQSCGQRSPFASSIDHGENCLLTLARREQQVFG